MEAEPEPEQAGEAMDHDSDSDEAMSEQGDGGAETPSPIEPATSRASLPSLPSMSHFTPATISPSIMPAHGYQQHRHYSISSASQASFSPYIHSAQTSPFFGPSYNGHEPSAAFSLTSPALTAQDAGQSLHHRGSIQHLALNGSDEAARQQQSRREQDLDHEATAALLMLNSDRRNWKDGSGRGMSVKDLLS